MISKPSQRDREPPFRATPGHPRQLKTAMPSVLTLETNHMDVLYRIDVAGNLISARAVTVLTFWGLKIKFFVQVYMFISAKHIRSIKLAQRYSFALFISLYPRKLMCTISEVSWRAQTDMPILLI